MPGPVVDRIGARGGRLVACLDSDLTRVVEPPPEDVVAVASALDAGNAKGLPHRRIARRCRIYPREMDAVSRKAAMSVAPET